MTPKTPSTPEEAIWEIYSRVISLEVTLRGTPNTQEGGLVQIVQEVKSLAVENKDALIEQGRATTWLQARCRAFHGDSGHGSQGDGGPGNGPKALSAGPGAANDNENPLAKISKARVITFLTGAALFVAMVIYNLGGLCGWWEVK